MIDQQSIIFTPSVEATMTFGVYFVIVRVKRSRGEAVSGLVCNRRHIYWLQPDGPVALPISPLPLDPLS